MKEMRRIQQQSSEQSYDRLNMAFIADDSKEIRDIEGISVRSISTISRKTRNEFDSSMIEQQFSNMQQWPTKMSPKQQQHGFKRKGKISYDPCPIIEQQVEWLDTIGRCSKKRDCGKCTVLVAKQKITKNEKDDSIEAVLPKNLPNGYHLRSKTKIINAERSNELESSSSQQIRQLIFEMGGSKKKSNSSTKNIK